MCALCTRILAGSMPTDAQSGLTSVCAGRTFTLMQLSDFMASKGLTDEEMALLVCKAGGKVERSTISRLRRGKTWLSKELAVAFARATGNAVTAADFAEMAEDVRT